MKIAIIPAGLLVCFLCCTGSALASWKADFERQPLSKRPKIEARYTDATRTGFDIYAQDYRLTLDMKSKSGQKVSALSVRGSDNILSKNGIYLQLTDDAGNLYSSLNTKKASRVNIYRRGPYYIETHWLDVMLTDNQGKLAPVKGEVVFYSYPEKTHIGVILHVTEPIQIKSAEVVIDTNARTYATPTDIEQSSGVKTNDFILLNRGEIAPTCALIFPVPKGLDDLTVEKTDNGISVSIYIYSSEAHNNTSANWTKGDKPSGYFELFPLESPAPTNNLEAEVRPLLSTSFDAASGQLIGYNPIRGCYRFRTDNPGGFSYHYYVNQNDYETTTFSVHNNDIPRKVYILHETRNNPGAVECGVVLDEAGATLPITVQISKNFAGEKEEKFYNPDDTPFSETFFPLYLEPDETRKLTSLHLYQNWGTHPLKQFSSLGAWMDYYHMSTGVTETTCYVPFLFGGLDGVSIADLRPMSQRMWDSQPQHDNIAGHSFLRYLTDDDTWHYIEYTGTTFRSTGPNWADMSMHYLSDDGKAKVTVDVFELPQTDELRNFMHIRVDFLDDIKIKDSDFTRYVRLLNIASWVQRMRYTHVAYGGPTGEAIVTPIKLNDDFTLAGAALPENGFAAAYPDKLGANAYIVRKFSGKIDGEPVASGVSLIGEKKGNTTLMLVPITKAKQIKSGDYIEADVFIMPYGGGVEDEKPPQKAAFDYGANAPRVTSISKGAQLADFPTRIALNENGKAEFSVTGGMNYNAIIVEGAKAYTNLRLYNMDSGKTLVDLSRKGERDGYQVFAKEDGTFGWVFLVNTDGKEHKYLVE